MKNTQLNTAPSPQHNSEHRMQSIVQYYDQTVLDYRVLWLNKDNRAIHFGYSDRPGMRHAEALVRLNEVMADMADIGPGDKVVDAGCGVGGSSMWLAANRDAQTVGLSPVPGQIAKATQLARARSLENQCQFFVGDYHHTKLEDASADVVWACESLCHSDSKDAFYREAFRILKPGGKLIIAEYLRNGRPLTKLGETLIHRWLDGWAIRDIDSLEEHRNNARAAGFSRFENTDITAYMEPSLRRLYKMSRALMPLAVFLKATKIRNDVQHRNVIASITQYQALKHGFWSYHLLSCEK